MSGFVLRARGLTLGYAEHTVLRGVDWTVQPGERWFLIGPNGAGKSTLLHALLGVLVPFAGSFELGPALGGRARLGYVPQRSDINRSMPTTVREFVRLGLVGTGTPRSEEARRLHEALARVDLAEHVGDSYWSLSGGQRQRALLARALVRRPTLLVLDEPTEGLDVVTQDALLETLDALHAEQGLTEVVVTHRLDIATDRATHVAFFHAGHVRCGRRDEVLAAVHRSGAFAGIELVSP